LDWFDFVHSKLIKPEFVQLPSWYRPLDKLQKVHMTAMWNNYDAMSINLYNLFVGKTGNMTEKIHF